MFRIIVLTTIIILSGCSAIKPSVYSRAIDETPPLNLNISEYQVREKLEQAYLNWLGTPYGYGRQQPHVAADCSGFTQRVFKNHLSVNIPRSTKQQINVGKKVKLKNAKAGDLVFFDLKNGYGHVGIYLDNNIVLQATSSKGVTKTDLNKEQWWAKRIHVVKRIIKS